MKAFLVAHQLEDDSPAIVGVVYAPSLEKAMPKIDEIIATNFKENGDTSEYKLGLYSGRQDCHQKSYIGGYPVVNITAPLVEDDDDEEWYNINEVPIHVVD